MARMKPETLRKKIEKDLTNQLKEKWIVGSHYSDMVQDYLSLWDLKCGLIKDIIQYGRRLNGMHGPKTNPAINDLHKTNTQMLKILSEIGIDPSPVKDTGGVKDDF